MKFCRYQFGLDHCILKETPCVLDTCAEYSPCDTDCAFLHPEIGCMYEGDEIIAKRKCKGT